MQDVDENFGRVEQAIDTLNANASLLWQGDASQSALDVIQANYPSLPHSCMRNVVLGYSGKRNGAIVYKYTNSHGKVILMPYETNGIVVFQLMSGTWSERSI
mgnify:CR=1 FL=1